MGWREAVLGERRGFVVLVGLGAESSVRWLEVTVRGETRADVVSDSDDPDDGAWRELSDALEECLPEPPAFQHAGSLMDFPSDDWDDVPDAHRSVAFVDDSIVRAERRLQRLPPRCERCGKPGQTIAVIDVLPVLTCGGCVAGEPMARLPSGPPSREQGKAALAIAFFAPAIGALAVSWIALRLLLLAAELEAMGGRHADSNFAGLGGILVVVVFGGIPTMLGLHLPRRSTLRPVRGETVALALGSALGVGASVGLLARMLGAAPVQALMSDVRTWILAIACAGPSAYVVFDVRRKPAAAPPPRVSPALTPLTALADHGG